MGKGIGESKIKKLVPDSLCNQNEVCNDKVLKLFGRRVGLCVEWSDVNGVQVCCK